MYSPVVRQLADRKLYNKAMWFVYALYNQDVDKIYIGEAHNVEKRVSEHNKKRGSHFTARYKGEWKLIYREEVDDRRKALVREKQLKSFKGREFIRQKIIKNLAPL